MLGQVINKVLHERKILTVVGCCCKNKLFVPEGVLNGLRHVLPCKVNGERLGAAALFKHFAKQTGSLFCVAVNRGVGYHNALCFNLV